MKAIHHVSSLTPLLGVGQRAQRTTHAHVMRTLKSEECINAARDAGMEKVYDQLFALATLNVSALGVKRMDVQVRQGFHDSFEEFVVCLKDKLPTCSISVFPK